MRNFYPIFLALAFWPLSFLFGNKWVGKWYTSALFAAIILLFIVSAFLDPERFYFYILFSMIALGALVKSLKASGILRKIFGK